MNRREFTPPASSWASTPGPGGSFGPVLRIDGADGKLRAVLMERARITPH